MFSPTKLEEMRPVSAINPRGGRGFNAPRRTKEVGSITNSRPSEAAREIEFRCTDAPDIPVNGNWYKAAGSVMIVTDAPEPIDPRSCATKPRRRAQLIEQSSNSLKSIYRPSRSPSRTAARQRFIYLGEDLRFGNEGIRIRSF